MAGHVFVTRGDLTALACAAWVVPGSHRPSGPHVRRHWLTKQSGLREQFDGGRLRDPDAVHGCGRIWRLRRLADQVAPHAYLMNSGGRTGERLEWYLEGLDEFLRALRYDGDLWRRAGVKRDRPLVGIPAFGTGAGGAKETRGQVIKAVLEKLYDAANDPDLGADFALVTYTEDNHAAAQWARRMLVDRDPWHELGDPRLEAVADGLALEAHRERLVLFLGAGISTGAGLPDWNQMIAELAKKAGIEPDLRADMEKLPIIDQARYVESTLRDLGKGRLQEAIVELMRASRCSLSHALLAALPVREVVTTNYDELFELASEGAGEPLAQLPYRPDRDKKRWILKLHGTVSEPAAIVVTREDYLGYHEQRAALAGIVQGLLITKHMLFVGFSLEDENFHRIVHDVRNALRAGSDEGKHQPFGTAVMLEDRPLRQALWREELEFAVTKPKRATRDGALAAARCFEIFLDVVGAKTSTVSSYLLDRAYDELLSETDRDLRDKFTRFLERVSSYPDAMAWQDLLTFAEGRGWKATATAENPLRRGSRRPRRVGDRL
jgi:hypothetical protein